MTSTPSLYHFSYHKCLTVFYKGVMTQALRPVPPFGAAGYVHLNSRRDELGDAARHRRLVSLNNHFVDPATLGDFRATRFIRDPRDLLVSGYHYHRRGAERWCDVVDPTPADWAVVNGAIPASLPAGTSYTAHLQAVSTEEGLLAELDFRRPHFDSMLQWPLDDERIRLFRYEEILGHEQETFAQVFDHLGIAGIRRRIGDRYAKSLSAGERTKGRSPAHIRDPRPRQWESMLTPDLLAELDRRHPGLLARYGYA